MLHCLGRNPRSLVGHGDSNSANPCCQHNFNWPFRSGILRGIAQQIDQNLPDRVRISPRIARCKPFYRDTMNGEISTNQFNNISHKRR